MKRVSRREFVGRAVKAGATVAGTGALAWALFDDSPPVVGRQEMGDALIDFRVTDSGPRLSVATGTDRVAMVRKAVEALGSIARFVRRGDRVLVKPNVGFATPPELCATAHPALVGEVVRMCLSAGASDVIVTDNPVNDPESCFRLTGIGDAVRSAGGRVVLPRSDQFRVASLPGGSLIREWPLLLGPFEGIDRVVGISPIKDHARAEATLSVKNWYGLLGGRRNVFHQRIHDLVLELAMLVRPTLVVLDGTVTMMRNGPTGGSLADLKQTRTMIVGTDPVAVDARGAVVLGLSPRGLPWIPKAEAAGLGTPDYESLDPAVVDAG